MVTRGKIYELLQQVIDPELGINIVDLGLVYDVEVDDSSIRVDFTLTYPGCPLGAMIQTRKGLDEEVINAISHHKEEPEWMRQYRLRSYRAFRKKPMPNWGADISDLDFDNIYYYAKPVEQQRRSWDDVPAYIKETFDRIGIPEAERKYLAGVGAQYDSEVVYHNLKEELQKEGVVFCDPETAVREHPDIVKEYFGTVIPFMDNKFAALNSAVWSGEALSTYPRGLRWTFPFRPTFVSISRTSVNSNGLS